MQIKDLPSTSPVTSTDVLAKETSGGTTNKIAISDFVVNNLTSTSTTKALSAAKGKALKDTINPLFGLNEIYGNGTISNCNNAAIGVWYVFYSSATNIPVTNAVGVLITVGSPGTGSGTVRYQIAFVRASGIDGVYVRAMNSGTWGSWTKIAS